jgi:hypothetical protein
LQTARAEIAPVGRLAALYPEDELKETLAAVEAGLAAAEAALAPPSHVVIKNR